MSDPSVSEVEQLRADLEKAKKIIARELEIPVNTVDLD